MVMIDWLFVTNCMVLAEGSGLTGIFAVDFPLLCEQSSLPVVAVRAIHKSR